MDLATAGFTLRNITDPLFLLGVAVFLGGIGARIFQKLRIPQVVGYIVIGIIVGRTGLKIIPPDVIVQLRPFNLFALGIIGFMVGGELKWPELRQRGRQFITILLAEGLAAFVVVGTLTGLATWFFTHNPMKSVSLGLLLGAISSATAPAATVDVLWEYKTRGPLTSTVLAIVALDDGLALFLYGFAASVAGVLLGSGVMDWQSMIGTPLYEIGVSLILGVVTGILLNYLLRWAKDPQKQLTFTLGTLLLDIGLSNVLNLDAILVAMALGCTLVNLVPRRSREAFDLVGGFATPLYVLFFVLVGARLSLTGTGYTVWIVAVLYLIGRTGGKMAGAYWGARLSGAADAVRKYLGLCLFSQAGVAVGLSILASQRFSSTIGDEIVIIIATTTFLVQIIGPPSVKVGVAKAGEIGLGMDENDLIRSYKVSDVMEAAPAVVHLRDGVEKILSVMSGDVHYLYYPVVDEAMHLKGVIGLDAVKPVLAEPETVRGLVLALDIMSPVRDIVTPDEPLHDAMSIMRETKAEFLPVVDKADERRLVGFIDARVLNRFLSSEILRRRRAAGGEMTMA
jgi:Kef-type K+ transport system membrane component KefB/predicted transcriptional regulator